MGKTSSSSSPSPVGITIHGSKYKIGPCLGSGAQASVHAILTERGTESLEWVAKIAPKPAKKSAPKKKLTMAEINANSIYHETTLYNLFAKLQGTSIPRVPPSWEKMPPFMLSHEGFTYIILERMAAPLTECVVEMINGNETNFGPIAVRAIEICQEIHSSHHILVDIKTENFMLSKPDSKDKSSLAERLVKRVRYLDLGLCRSFRDEYRKHVAPSERGLEGTPLFVSLHVHDKSAPSRRDDMFSLGLVFADLLIRYQAKVDGTVDVYEKGKIPTYLPWASQKSDNEIYSVKKELILNQNSLFYTRMPDEVAGVLFEFFTKAHEMNFKQTPDYSGFCDLARKLVMTGKATKKASKTSVPKENNSKQKASESSSRKRKAPLDQCLVDVAAASSTGTRQSQRIIVKAQPAEQSTKKQIAQRRKLDDAPVSAAYENKRSCRSERNNLDSPFVNTAHIDELASVVESENGVELMDIDEPSDNGDTQDRVHQMKEAVKEKKIVNKCTKDPNNEKRLGSRLVVTKSPHGSSDEYTLVQGVNDVVIVGANPEVSDGEATWKLSGDSKLANNHAKLELLVMRGNARVKITNLTLDHKVLCAGITLGSGKQETVYAGQSVQIEGTHFTVQRWSGSEPDKDSGINSGLDTNHTALTTAEKKTRNNRESVAKGKTARVCIKEGPHAGEEWIFDVSKPQKINIGSDPPKRGWKISLPKDENVEKNHARLDLSSNSGYLKIFVTDLKTDIGTIVNGRLVPKGKSMNVRRDQIIQLGDTALVVLTK